MSSLLITDPRGRPKAEEMLLRLHLSDDWNKDSCKLKSIPQHKTEEDDGFESFIKNEHPIKDRQKEQSSDDCESESESYFQWFMKQKITKWIIVTIRGMGKSTFISKTNQTKPDFFFSWNWTKFGMQKLAANSSLHAKFEANRRSFEVRGQNSGLLSFVEFTSMGGNIKKCLKRPRKL